MLRPLWRAGHARALAHAAALAACRRAFEARGLRVTPLKGVAFQAAMTGASHGRDHRDLDLWIAPDDLTAALELLVDLGWQLPDRSGANELQLSHPDGLTLDLHHRLFAPRYALDDVDPLLADLRAPDGALPPEAHAFLALLHGAKDGWSTLRHLADAKAALDHLPDALLSAWARQTRTCGIVAANRDLVAALEGRGGRHPHPVVRPTLEALRAPRVEAPTPARALAYLRTRESLRDRVEAVAAIPVQHSAADVGASGVGRVIRRSVRLFRSYGPGSRVNGTVGGIGWHRTACSAS